jgi:hypothetical protein
MTQLHCSTCTRSLFLGDDFFWVLLHELILSGLFAGVERVRNFIVRGLQLGFGRSGGLVWILFN